MKFVKFGQFTLKQVCAIAWMAVVLFMLVYFAWSMLPLFALLFIAMGGIMGGIWLTVWAMSTLGIL